MGAQPDKYEEQENELLEQQIRENNANIERERRNLAERRLEIIKEEGEPNWKPQPPPYTPPKKILGKFAGETISQQGNLFDVEKIR